MIYLDSSVVLAHLFLEAQSAPASLWDQQLVSSRLLQYEVWNRVHARGLTGALKLAEILFARIGLFELEASRLARALEPFPVPIRTLDSLHMATILYLRQRQPDVELASFDRRMIAAARALGVPLFLA